MSDSASWFARKLNGPQQQPPPQSYAQPPQQYQGQQQYPSINGQQPPQSPYGQQSPQQYYDDEQARQTAAQQALAMVKAGQASIGQVVGLFRGSKKVRSLEPDNCPECGSANYFNRGSVSSSHGAGGKLMKPDGTTVQCAPVCMDCGYNGRYEQFGAMPVAAEAPVQVDNYSQNHITTFDPQRHEWVPS